MIEEINFSIKEKDKRLKIKVERTMDLLIDSVLSDSNELAQSKVNNGNQKFKTNNISKAAFGLAGVLALIGCVSNEGRGWLFASAAAVGLTGYCIGNINTKKSKSSIGLPKMANFDKSNIKNKSFKLIQEIKDEWAQFMVSKQKQVRFLIDKSNISEKEKELKLKKIFVFEEIDFPLLEASNILDKNEGALNFKNDLLTIKNKFIEALDEACKKQLNIYYSLNLK